ncbi:hypothetical protein NC652_021065 [Populus alba x Populus x berolinensis]|nr:hypothetical protein NC652_021065 [Populus alba x Populus x berolinensis]
MQNHTIILSRTAESVRDSLIINWNATYEYYEKMNVKQAYYLTMECLQGRALLNAIGNLELSGAYADALRKLEDVAAGQSSYSVKSRSNKAGNSINNDTTNTELSCIGGMESGPNMACSKSSSQNMANYLLHIEPRDESVEGKTLGLKQQYTLCSASLQDIIAHFERRSGKPVKWESFAVQTNDTCPALCVLELIRILMDWKVVPEALEKWRPFQELLPRHVEITRMIDEELIHAIVVEYGAEDLNLLRQKLKQMRIFYNIGLPESVLELLVKLESSAVDSIEEVEVSDEETESTDEEQSEQ